MGENTQTSTVYLFCGEDDYSVTEKVNFWKNAFIKKHGDTALEIMDGKKINAAQFITNIESMPFLSEKRMTIIKDFLTYASDNDQQLVAKNLSKTPDFNFIIFHETKTPDKRKSIFKTIQKVGKTEIFDKKDIRSTNQWILKKASDKKLQITPQTASYLSQQCGTNLWTLSNELDKLKLFLQDKEVDTKTIDEICIPSLSSSIFKLTDEIAKKNAKESLKILKILVESGEDISRIFYMIAGHFRVLIQVHQFMEMREPQFSIVKKLNKHPFVIQKASGQCRNFTLENLKVIHEKLLKIDTEAKTGGIKSFRGDKRQMELAIEKLILDCCL